MRSSGSLLSIALFAAIAHAGQVLQSGATFPSWNLVDQTGAKVASRDLAGTSYLLWFFPKASTPGCTMEGNGLRDEFAEFQARGVTILGVSFDTPADNAAFVKEQGFPFRLLSDADHALAVAVGAAATSGQQYAQRISYLVGPDGKVVKAYPEVTPKTHAQDVLADLGARPAAAPTRAQR